MLLHPIVNILTYFQGFYDAYNDALIDNDGKADIVRMSTSLNRLLGNLGHRDEDIKKFISALVHESKNSSKVEFQEFTRIFGRTLNLDSIEGLPGTKVGG